MVRSHSRASNGSIAGTRQTALGRYCEFKPQRSSRRRGANRPIEFVRPQYLALPSFRPAPAGEANEGLMAGSVSTASAGRRQQPLDSVEELDLQRVER